MRNKVGSKLTSQDHHSAVPTLTLFNALPFSVNLHMKHCRNRDPESLSKRFSGNETNVMGCKCFVITWWATQKQVWLLLATYHSFFSPVSLALRKMGEYVDVGVGIYSSNWSSPKYVSLPRTAFSEMIMYSYVCKLKSIHIIHHYCLTVCYHYVTLHDQRW